MTQAHTRATPSAVPDTAIRCPQICDGVRLWQIAKASKVLDVNSSYSYLLWCRDFDDTSVVATVDGDVVGFVTGFIRPHAPDTLFVWQVAVDETARGRGLAAHMLHRLLDNLATQHVSTLETTISPDNAASIALFTAVARDRGTSITRQNLFDPNHFPDQHGTEDLYRIGPMTINPEGSAQP